MDLNNFMIDMCTHVIKIDQPYITSPNITFITTLIYWSSLIRIENTNLQWQILF